MAQSKNNIITHGLSGKIGDLIVFSQRGNRTIVSKAPREQTGEASTKQKEVRSRFQQAVLYAKSVMSDPASKSAYADVADQEKGISAYNIAVADLFNAPEIEEINLSLYTGNLGDVIAVKVTDDFKVVQVKVSIHNADGTLVEEGAAVEQGTEWIYTATVKNDNLAGDKITIQASDLPENISEKTQVL